MRNRTLPLGYRTENGAVVITDSEAEIVKTIFTQYGNGTSLKELVGLLNEQNIEFKQNAVPWNKGRVYHILTDSRYTGEKNFPQIITVDVFEKVNRLKNSKGGNKKELSETVSCLKKLMFCGKCGGKLLRNANGRWSCANGCAFHRRPTDEMLLSAIAEIIEKANRLPELLSVAHKDTGYKQTPEIMRLTNEMARMNEQMIPSFNTGKAILFRLAASKFAACKEDKSVYTEYVSEQVKCAAISQAIDKEFLQNAVQKILIVGKDEYEMVFVNGAVVSNKAVAENAS